VLRQCKVDDVNLVGKSSFGYFFVLNTRGLLIRNFDIRTVGSAMDREPLDVKVLIVAENASFKFGGEAALPIHYYRILRQRQVPTWLVVHERTREELEALFPDDKSRIFYIADTAGHRLLWRMSKFLPRQLASFTVEFVMRMMTQISQRRLVRELIRDNDVSVIHQPIPVSPKEPSMIYGMGVPVIIGPMNGGMDYPPAFKKMQGRLERFALGALRNLSNLMNILIPGKRKAALLLVANERTRAALPHGVCERVVTVVENGVDLSLWHTPQISAGDRASPVVSFVFVGRLVDWKAVDLLLIAFKQAGARAPMSLTIIGDGSERSNLEGMAHTLGILGSESGAKGKVRFRGWMSQAQCAVELRSCDALVLPSLMECGGAVVLEAMAMEIPVVATDWGGPADYLDASCGILVEPTSREEFICNLEAALYRIATDEKARLAMGRAGRSKVVREFDWNSKVDAVFTLYRDVAARRNGA